VLIDIVADEVVGDVNVVVDLSFNFLILSKIIIIFLKINFYFQKI
jgi:hypothetical protein